MLSEEIKGEKNSLSTDKAKQLSKASGSGKTPKNRKMEETLFNINLTQEDIEKKEKDKSVVQSKPKTKKRPKQKPSETTKKLQDITSKKEDSKVEIPLATEDANELDDVLSGNKPVKSQFAKKLEHFQKKMRRQSAERAKQKEEKQRQKLQAKQQQEQKKQQVLSEDAAVAEALGDSIDSEVDGATEKVQTYYPYMEQEMLQTEVYEAVTYPHLTKLKVVLRNLGPFAVEELSQLFYRLGYYAEVQTLAVLRVLKFACKKAGTGISWLFALLWQKIKTAVKAFAEVFTAPVARMARGFGNIRQVIRDEKEKGVKHAGKEALVYFNRGVRDYRHLAVNLLLWLTPICALGVFVFTVNTVMNYQYALAIEYEGTLVGYVETEKVYEDAQARVQEKIIYVEDGAEQWRMEPTFHLTVADTEQLQDSEQLSNAILEASGAEIIEAAGLYVDGMFYGATTDSLQLYSDLENIKAPYLSEDPSITVDFEKQVDVRDGVYLSDSVVDYSQISTLLSSQVEGERVYTVISGDTPSGIAAKNGITTSDLYALNPSLENGKVLFVGMELLISKAEAFLPVQVIQTVTEQEEVPFQTITTDTSDLLFNQQKIVTKGENGLNELVVQYTYVDGLLKSREVVSTTVLVEPITQETLRGTYVSPNIQMTQYSGGALMWPVPAYRYMSRGFTGVYAHNGLDICAGYGTPIYAAEAGVVTKALYTNRGYGVYVMLSHGGGLQTLYGHCSSLAVSAGQVVQKGQVIAYMGSTGNSTGNHCHFEVIVNGVRVNPMGYFG
ncbi:MAG: peptidoglycan DD-metalloendopeptidase family protein [Oscillospiraceae bacterium]|nr:peptidoglycan DD-metalloendopeptidase family protein [Oscillospiraceae bacterium]